MADYSWRTVKKVTREYTVPTHEPWGAANAEISKAYAAAVADYRQTKSLSDDAPLFDNDLMWFARDDEIVIAFTIEESSDG